MTDVFTEDPPALVPQLEGDAAPPSDEDDADSVVRSWGGSKIRELVRSSELRRRYDRWMTLVENKLPRFDEMLGSDQSNELNDAMVLLLVPNDFSFVHQGPAALKMIGTNLTGTLLSARKTAIANGVRKVYAKCVSMAEPIYIRHVASVASNQHFFLEQIALPVAADDRREINFVLVYSAPLDDKNEILRAVFERSQIGMIAAASSHDEGGKLQNGRILLMNSIARKILKIQDSAPKLHSVRDLGPWFRDGALWTKTNVVASGKQTHIHYLDRGTSTNYRVTIEPIDNFVLFSIIEVSKPE